MAVKNLLKDPAFFDIFGFIAFIFIILIAVSLLRKKGIHRIFYWILLIVGILGAIIDILMVYSRFFILE